MNAVSLASSASEWNSWSRFCPFIDAFKSRIAFDHFIVIIPSVLSALCSQRKSQALYSNLITLTGWLIACIPQMVPMDCFATEEEYR